MNIPGFTAEHTASSFRDRVVMPQGLSLDGLKYVAHHSLQAHFGKDCYPLGTNYFACGRDNLTCLDAVFGLSSGCSWSPIGSKKVANCLNTCCR